MNLNNKQWIAYVLPFPFPWGQAASRRVCGIAKSLANSGHCVVVGSGEEIPKQYKLLEESEHNGSISYIGLGELPNKTDSAIKKFKRYFYEWGSKTIAWLNSQPNKPSHIIVYGGGSPYMIRLLSWCKKNNVKLVADIVEWYDSRQMTGGKFGPFNLSNKLALRYLYPKCNGIIAISSWLENYYKTRGCNVIRIPPTIDTFNYIRARNESNSETSILKLVYAGTPGKKDLLKNIITAVEHADPKHTKINLKIIGPSVDNVIKLLGKEILPPSVNVIGPVPQSDVPTYVAEADFTVLLREPAKFSNAGFPTKFVESFACGTPVISNPTSDISKYLRDGINGFLCNEHSVESLTKSLKKALDLTQQEKSSMKLEAQLEAKKSFDFRIYSDDLNLFLDKV